MKIREKMVSNNNEPRLNDTKKEEKKEIVSWNFNNTGIIGISTLNIITKGKTEFKHETKTYNVPTEFIHMYNDYYRLFAQNLREVDVKFSPSENTAYMNIYAMAPNSGEGIFIEINLKNGTMTINEKWMDKINTIHVKEKKDVFEFFRYSLVLNEETKSKNSQLPNYLDEIRRKYSK